MSKKKINKIYIYIKRYNKQAIIVLKVKKDIQKLYPFLYFIKQQLWFYTLYI